MKFITRQAAKKLCSHSKKTFCLFTLTLLIFSSFLLLNQTAKAQPVSPTCAIEQITDETNGDSFNASINADGTRIAFSSNADINGVNVGGNFEIYLFDTTTGIITQITNETTGSSLNPSINADGMRIAFWSEGNINGGNPEGNTEIYLYTCLDPASARNIPTLSEWGLISMAGILGIVGFMVMRRRKIAV